MTIMCHNERIQAPPSTMLTIVLHSHTQHTENRYYDPVHDLMRQWGLVKEELVE